MMETSNGNSDSSFDSISRELIRLRSAAATALKNIDSLYEDIMGCPSSVESERESVSASDDRNSFDVASDRDDTESSLNNNFFRGVPLHLWRDVPHRHDHCHRCHRIINPWPRVYRQPCNVMYGNDCTNQSQCPSCGRLNGAYIHNVHPAVVTEPIKVTITEDVVNFDREQIVKHECPLKVTIPEPFKMTIREDGKKEMKELRKKELKKTLNEAVEKELRKKIHSNPVPGHIYVPVYQKMIESNEQRKKTRKEIAEKLAKESVKPFNFSKPKKIHFRRSGSVPQLNVEEEEERPVIFKAKPLPKKILSSDINERLKNSEIVRKQRIRQRAEELLQQSSLPFSNKGNLKRSVSAMNLKEKYSNSDIDSKKFDVRQEKYKFMMTQDDCREIMKSWNVKVSEFHKSCRAPPHHSFASDIQHKPKPLPMKSAHYDVPVRKTAASMLREEMVRNELLGKQGRDKNKVREDVKKKQDFKGSLSNRLKLASLSPNAQRDLEKKLQEFRISRKNRQLEYERELKEMRKRIEKTPLLIERQTNKNKGVSNASKTSRSEDNSQSESSQMTETQSGSKDGGGNDTSDDQEDLPESSS